MAIVDLNEKNFEETVSRDGIVLVDCWAPWCAPCKEFGPVFEKAAGRCPDHVFAKFNAEHNKEYAAELGLLGIPTIMLFRDGILLLKETGYYEEEKLLDIISQAEALDMDEVRRRVERERARRRTRFT